MWCEYRPTLSSVFCSFWRLSTFPLASPAADSCLPRRCMDWLPPIIGAAARHYLERVAKYPKILTGRKQKASCLGWQEKDDQVSGAAASKWKICPWRITWSLFEQNVGLARTGSTRLSLHQRKAQRKTSAHDRSECLTCNCITLHSHTKVHSTVKCYYHLKIMQLHLII